MCNPSNYILFSILGSLFGLGVLVRSFEPVCVCVLLFLVVLWYLFREKSSKGSTENAILWPKDILCGQEIEVLSSLINTQMVSLWSAQ